MGAAVVDDPYALPACIAAGAAPRGVNGENTPRLANDNHLQEKYSHYSSLHTAPQQAAEILILHAGKFQILHPHNPLTHHSQQDSESLVFLLFICWQQYFSNLPSNITHKEHMMHTRKTAAIAALSIGAIALFMSYGKIQNTKNTANNKSGPELTPSKHEAISMEGHEHHEKTSTPANKTTEAKTNMSPEESLQFAMQLYECHSIKLNDMSKADSAQTQEELEAAIIETAKIKNWCDEISNENIANYDYYLQYAADAGITEAQMLYSTLVADILDIQDALRDPQRLQDYKTRSIHYWKQAAKSGNTTALLYLGVAYQDGILVEQSLPTAYAYIYSYYLSKDAQNQSNLLNQIEPHLTRSQIEIAQQNGRLIYENCCIPIK